MTYIYPESETLLCWHYVKAVKSVTPVLFFSSFCPLTSPPFFFLCALSLLFRSSGAGRQQEAGQAEANRGEPGAPSEGGTAKDCVGPTGAYPGGVGPHPYGD